MLVVLVSALAGAVPVGGALAASPTFRMTVSHYLRGCHVWMTTKVLGPSTTITIARGTRLDIRVSCPMDFDFKQVAGPRLLLGKPRTFAGTHRTIVFKKPGLYRLVAKNVQTSEQQGLQTLGPDSTLRLTVRVR